MSVEEVYKTMLYVINKNQSASFSPDDFNRVINAAQNSYINYLLGEFQQYQYGRAQARVQFGQNTIIRERLAPFLSNIVTLTPNSDGVVALPADYLAFDTITYGANNESVKLIQRDRISDHQNSVIDPPSSRPFAIRRADGFQVVPVDLNIKLAYIKKPTAIRYAFTTDTQARPVYDAANSVSPLWADVDMWDIIVRALAMVGVNLQSASVQQYSQMIKTQGQ